jgi:Alpha/beta hydrolase domain
MIRRSLAFAMAVFVFVVVMPDRGFDPRLLPGLPGGLGHVTPVRAAPVGKSRVVRLQITRRGPFAGGIPFGTTGPYEKLVGTAYLELDPADPHNAIIQDVTLAPRNAQGIVEYATDVYVLKPLDMRRGNGVLLYDVLNRGNKPALGFNAGAPLGNDPDGAGDGFLQRKGYTIVWSGWQADVLPGGDRLTMRVPVARHPDGSTITGTVRAELIVNAATNTLNLSSGSFTGLTHSSYETASADNATATLTQRRREADARTPVPNGDWAFADCTNTPFPGTASTSRICLRNGFQPDFIYELLYTAKNPLVLGLGFSATRDVVSFFRNAPADDQGTSNPLAGNVRATLMYGASQSGRFMRTFLDLGFNQDSTGRIVFDGMMPHIATGRIPLNVRFGQPGRAYGQHEDHLYPGFESPLTWGPVSDPLARRTAFLLARCRQQGSCPKIMQTVTDTEYWQGRMSLNTADALGQRDIPIPSNVRIYFFASTQHAPAVAPARGICQQLSNPNPSRETARALLVALERWVRRGAEPPASRYPTLREGTLVLPNQGRVGWPNIPGVKYTGSPNGLTLLSFGPQFSYRTDSGIVLEPPAAVSGRDYVVLVPNVDGDGNEIAGVRSTMIQAPLGTHTGWNLRRAGFSEDELCGLTGSYIPFAKSKAERMVKGDPRPSLEERYGTHDRYVEAVRGAAGRLVTQGFLLPEDAARVIREARDSSVLRDTKATSR